MAMRHGYSHESRQTRPALVNKVVAATAVHLQVEAKDLKLVGSISTIPEYSAMKTAAGFVARTHATLQ